MTPTQPCPNCGGDGSTADHCHHCRPEPLAGRVIGGRATPPLQKLTEREMLLHMRPWLRKVASTMTAPDQIEEYAQEGWIAIWRAAPRWPGSGDFETWCKAAARNRMLNILRAEQAEKRDRRMTVLFDDLADALHPSRWPRAAELAYHASEINEALLALPDRHREYVLLRFWNEWTRGELDDHFDTRNSGRMWQTARPKLAQRLGHLKGVAL